MVSPSSKQYVFNRSYNSITSIFSSSSLYG
nr:MAG TPA: hypothetical protein [Caudoviricetes sp.]